MKKLINPFPQKGSLIYQLFDLAMSEKGVAIDTIKKRAEKRGSGFQWYLRVLRSGMYKARSPKQKWRIFWNVDEANGRIKVSDARTTEKQERKPKNEKAVEETFG